MTPPSRGDSSPAPPSAPVFATHASAGKFDVVPPTLAHRDDFTIAYWQVGEVAYALVVKAEPKDLSEVATGLATSLY
jgi:hypothetical protein